VAAVNDRGQSESLVTTKPIIAKHPFGMHWHCLCLFLSLSVTVTIVDVMEICERLSSMTTTTKLESSKKVKAG